MGKRRTKSFPIVHIRRDVNALTEKKDPRSWYNVKLLSTFSKIHNKKFKNGCDWLKTLQQFNKNFQNSRQIDIGCQYNEAKDSSIWIKNRKIKKLLDLNLKDNPQTKRTFYSHLCVTFRSSFWIAYLILFQFQFALNFSYKKLFPKIAPLLRDRFHCLQTLLYFGGRVDMSSVHCTLVQEYYLFLYPYSILLQ